MIKGKLGKREVKVRILPELPVLIKENLNKVTE